MNSDLYERIISERGSLENLIAKIPGFKGYHEKNARRQADRMLRDFLAAEFQQIVNRYGRIEREMLDGGKGLRFMSRSREVKSKLQSYVDRVQTAAPKYDGMWAAIKIDEEMLDRIYSFDQAQMHYIGVLNKAIDRLEEQVDSGEEFGDALESVYDKAQEAIDAFALRDDVIMQIGTNAPAEE